MKRWLPTLPIALGCFAAMLAVIDVALRAGLLPDDSVVLWARAVASADGEVPLGRIVSGYPSIPFLATTLMEVVTPAGTPTPALLAALVLAMIAASCFKSFRESGVGVLAATAATCLIAFHPALIRAAVAGPAEMFLALFLLVLAKGLYDLRERSTAPEVMVVALAMVGLVFSHPMGAAIVVAAVPFLVLAVRPALIANSALNVVVALIFPTIFCVGAFVYVSWVFPGSGWSFLAAPSASLAAWVAATTGVPEFPGSLTAYAGATMAVALVLGAPVAVAAIVRVRRRRPLVTPALVLTAAAVTGSMIAVITGVFGEPTPAIVVAPILAAIIIVRVPEVRQRLPLTLALLVCGWLGGACAVTAIDPRVARHLGGMIDGGDGDRARLDALNLGNVTAGRDGVLVDTFNAPAIVLGRGGARGLYAPETEPFALAMLFARFDAPFIAVPDPQSSAGALDQLNKLFPKLYRAGAPGYRLVYQNLTWRLFERIGKSAVAND